MQRISTRLSLYALLMFFFMNVQGQDCSNATELFIGTCTYGNLEGTVFSGDFPNCHSESETNEGSAWYYFTAPPSGLVTIKSNAEFNDVLTLYPSSSCSQMFQLVCSNKDEYGFRGEELNLALSGNQEYYVRISGSISEYSAPVGEYCIELEASSSIIQVPYNDDCTSPKILIVDGSVPLNNEHNVNASIDVVPDRNLKSRASVWYKFLAPADGEYRIKTNASFSDAIVVYNNDCTDLTEIVSEVDGYGLRVEGLTQNSEYLIQVSSYFAGLTGPLQVEVTSMPSAPANNECEDGVFLIVNDPCTNGTFIGAHPSEGLSECTVYQGPGVWYLFIAPASQKVHLNVEADYPYNASLWSGPCASREELWCVSEVSSCEENSTITNLQPNYYYYLYISASPNFYNPESDFCISLVDGDMESPSDPLVAETELICYADGSSEFQVNLSGGTPPYSHYGTQNGDLLYFAQEFEYTIIDAKGCAVNEVSLSNCFNIESQCPKVTDLDTLTVGSNNVTLNWSEPDLNSSYILRYKPVSSTAWTKANITGNVAFVSGLSSCTLYEAQIISDCDIISSGYSESMYFTTKNCAVCSAPNSLFEFNVTGNSAILTWDVSVAADSYLLNYRKVGTPTWYTYETTFPVVVLFGLSTCSDYEYFVDVSCGGLVGASVSQASFSTLSCKTGTDPIVEIGNALNVYPNPASDEVNIEFEEALQETILMSIYNMKGKLIHSEIVYKDAQMVKLDIEKLNISSGIYRIEISNRYSSFSEKLIVQ